MAKLLALYEAPTDPAAFAAYYESTHLPIARQMPGLRSIETSTGPVMSPSGAGPYHLIAILTFDSIMDLQAALASPEGRRTGADLANFATGGVNLLVFESQVV